MFKRLQEISSAGLLSHLSTVCNIEAGEGDAGAGGGDSGGKQEGAGDEGAGESGDDDGGGGEGDDDDDDSASSLLDLLADDDDDDDIDLSLEDDSDPAQVAAQSEKQKQAAKALGAHINKQIEEMAIKESDLPDMNDPAAVSTFMSTQNQKLARTVVSMMPHILNHSLGIIVPQLEKHAAGLLKTGSKKSEALTAIDGLGYTGKNRAAAVSIYERARKRKYSHKKALAATEKSMIAMKVPKGSSKRSKQDDSGSTHKEGAAALDAVFGG